MVTLLKANCQVAAREINSEGHAKDASCEAWQEEALERIAALRPSLVMLGESAGAVDNPRMSERPSHSTGMGKRIEGDAKQTARDGYKKTLVMADTPLLVV